MTTENNFFPVVFEEDTDRFVITNNGTAPTPCVLTYIPTVDTVLLTITGLSKEPITVSNVRADDVLVIDGVNRSVLINESLAFGQYNGWEFPKLQPGVNTITITNGS